MSRPSRTALTWASGLLLLGAPIFVTCALLYPQATRFAEPVVCTDGLTLTNDVGNVDTPFDNRALCESDTRLIDVTDRVVMIGVGAVAAAAAGYLLRHRLEPRRLSAPRSPATR